MGMSSCVPHENLLTQELFCFTVTWLLAALSNIRAPLKSDGPGNLQVEMLLGLVDLRVRLFTPG